MTKENIRDRTFLKLEIKKYQTMLKKDGVSIQDQVWIGLQIKELKKELKQLSKT